MTQGFAHTPPKESGWHGERYIEDDLELFVDELSEARSPAVYMVKLSVPHEWETVEETWTTHFDVDMPEFIREAFDSNVCVYVGATKDLLERLHTHMDNPNQSSAIARVFPFHSLWDVRWFDDVGEAFDREHGIAMNLDNKYDGMYVHSR